MSELSGTVVDAGYAKFCPCGNELFFNDCIGTCEKGHRWQAKVETYQHYPFGPKYQAQQGERVVWTQLEAKAPA